jgi:hypothetical protein
VAGTSLFLINEAIEEVIAEIPTVNDRVLDADDKANPMYRELKSFDRVLEVVAPVLTTTPDLGKAYELLTLWRLVTWRLYYALRASPRPKELRLQREAQHLRDETSARLADWRRWYENHPVRDPFAPTTPVDPGSGLANATDLSAGH